MKPGRLPEDHPLEQAARAKLREPSPEARAKRAAEAQVASYARELALSTRPDPQASYMPSTYTPSTPSTRTTQRPAPDKPRRWQ